MRFIAIAFNFLSAFTWNQASYFSRLGATVNSVETISVAHFALRKSSMRHIIFGKVLGCVELNNLRSLETASSTETTAKLDCACDINHENAERIKVSSSRVLSHQPLASLHIAEKPKIQSFCDLWPT